MKTYERMIDMILNVVLGILAFLEIGGVYAATSDKGKEYMAYCFFVTIISIVSLNIAMMRM